MKNLVWSWNAKSEKTTANYFKKANISHANQQRSVTDAGDPFKSLEEEPDNLRKSGSKIRRRTWQFTKVKPKYRTG